MPIHDLLAFAGAFLVFAASPGPDNLTILARTLSHGAGSGIAYGLGTVSGILIFLVAAAFGLDALARHYAPLFEILRWLGAGYLVVAGLRLWCAPAGEARPRALEGGFGRIWLTGLALNLGNPKMPLFYLALLPAVFAGGVPGGLGLVELVATVLVVEALVIGGHVLLARRARRLLARPRARRMADRAAAACMIGTGVVAAARG